MTIINLEDALNSLYKTLNDKIESYVTSLGEEIEKIGSGNSGGAQLLEVYSDLNSFTSYGHFISTTSTITKNLPDSISGNTLRVENENLFDNSEYILQTVTDDTGKTCQRVAKKSSSGWTWGAWKELTTANINILDISGTDAKNAEFES